MLDAVGMAMKTKMKVGNGTKQVPPPVACKTGWQCWNLSMHVWWEADLDFVWRFDDFWPCLAFLQGLNSDGTLHQMPQISIKDRIWKYIIYFCFDHYLSVLLVFDAHPAHHIIGSECHGSPEWTKIVFASWRRGWCNVGELYLLHLTSIPLFY